MIISVKHPAEERDAFRSADEGERRTRDYRVKDQAQADRVWGVCEALAHFCEDPHPASGAAFVVERLNELLAASGVNPVQAPGSA